MPIDSCPLQVPLYLRAIEKSRFFDRDRNKIFVGVAVPQESTGFRPQRRAFACRHLDDGFQKTDRAAFGCAGERLCEHGAHVGEARVFAAFEFFVHDEGRYQILCGTATDGAVPSSFPDERLSDSSTVVGEIVMLGIKRGERVESIALEMWQLVREYVERIEDDDRAELRALARGDRRRLAFRIDDEDGTAQG